MGKKIVVLNGSPRKNGNTSALVREFTKGAESVGNTVTEFFLNSMDIHGCLGCFGGRSSRECPCVQKDDMSRIYPAVKDCDVVVLATPLYYWNMSGQLRTAIDRLFALEEGIEIAKLLESYGYDLLNVDTGTYDSFYYACPPMYMPKGFLVDLAEKAKAAVKIPVIGGGRMNDPDIAEKAVREGKMDGVVLGRASLADPEYPNKVISGHPEKIRPCLGCNLGCINRLLKDGKPACCAVNPTAMRELEYGIQPASEKKKVLVVGGGVAGMKGSGY